MMDKDKYKWVKGIPYCKKCGTRIQVETIGGGVYFYMHYARCVTQGA
jgi:hypothetical protein